MSAEAETAPNTSAPAPAPAAAPASAGAQAPDTDMDAGADASAARADAPSNDLAPPAPAEQPAAESKANGDGAPPSSRASSRRKSAPAPTSSTAAPKKPAAPRASMPKGGSGGVTKKNSGSAGAGAGAGDGVEKNFKHGDVVLARLKGYPPWPARIVGSAEEIPRKVQDARPGKSSTIHCVQYFPAGDYSWLHNREINPLSPKDISDFLNGGHRSKTGGLREAYETAQDPTEWLAGVDAARAQAEEAAAGEDELEDDDDGAGAAGGKRKKGPGSKAPKKKAKTEKKESKPKSEAKAAPKSESKPAEPQTEEERMAQDPECIKVKDWRHKLQRAFLGKGLPTADEMPNYDEQFKTIEEYQNMSIDALTFSKIGKVMKKISALDGIPRNDEFKITDRAGKLMHKWQEFISANGHANGDIKEDD